MLANLPPRYRLPLLLLGLIALVSGVSGGLLRQGAMVSDSGYLAPAINSHGVLMVTAFFGTVISLERAVALAQGPWYLGPLCAGLGGVALLGGEGLLPESALNLAPALFIAAALIFCAGSWRVWQRQRAMFTLTLGLGALNWLLGNVAWLTGQGAAAVAFWISFLLLTIAGERLELTRLRPPQTRAVKLFAAILVLIHIGSALVLVQAETPLFALGLLAMACWLARFDIAWTTVRSQGLPRFVAVCLLAGYAQLAIGALMGLDGAFASGHPWRDAALHAIFLGFVFSMVMGHAPIIFPAVMRVRIPYHPVFYLPLLVLQVSVMARVAASVLGDTVLRQWASLGNAAALGLLIVTLLGRVIAGRVADHERKSVP
ncbi:MAG: hypothetical protein IPH08_10800 [Rhodocyclaceae bacterium]|nr:hypothetical protein [Rhodocyclaceae bacterium]